MIRWNRPIAKIAAGFFAWLLILSCAGLACGDGLEDARRRGRLLAGVKTDFPPFGYLDAAGGHQGFDADLARQLGRALFEGERGVELVPVSSGGRIPLLYSGLIDDTVATLTITEDRRRVLEFSDPYAMAVRKGERRFIEWLNAQLIKMKADGTLLELRRKHFGDLDADLLKP